MASNDVDDRLEELRRRANNHGFNRVIEFSLDDVGDDWARASIPHLPEFVNPPTERVMHGGITATVLDATMGYAVMSALYDDPSGTIGPTLNLDIDYVATADEPLDAQGAIVRRGRNVAFVSGMVEGTESGKTVATAQGIWLIFDN